MNHPPRKDSVCVLDCKNVVLSRKEYKLLLKIKEDPNLVFESKYAKTLMYYGLIKANPIFEIRGIEDMEIGYGQFFLTEDGHAYLKYKKNEKKNLIFKIMIWVVAGILAVAVSGIGNWMFNGIKPGWVSVIERQISQLLQTQ